MMKKWFGINERQAPETRSKPIKPQVQPGLVRKTSAAPVSSPYRAVTIVCGSQCCQVVKSVVGKTMLARSAPPLPLPECTMPQRCACRFEKHPDRRESDERRSPDFSTTGVWYAGPERREKRSRRRGPAGR